MGRSDIWVGDVWTDTGFTGKSLFELEYLATVEPGCLRGFFVATQAEASANYFVPTRAKA